MKNMSLHHQAWQDARALLDEATRQEVAAVVDRAAPALADTFYSALLDHPQAGGLLDHEVVNTRLHASMARWLRELFRPDTPVADSVAAQERTGAVHARIGVSIDMVSLGARVLKRGIAQQLVTGGLPRRTLILAVQYAYEMVDLAVDAMNQAYARGSDRLTRSDEAYRLQFLSQNMKAERERQKSGLLEWAHQILLHYFWDAPDGATPLGSSQFGLWLRHKASLLFEGAPQVALIEAEIAVIEGQLLPELARVRGDREASMPAVRAINQRVDEIKRLLGDMFDSYVAAEDGQEGGGSRVLNRRYFPAVAKREIALAQRHQGGFALLVLELDGLAGLRDVLGAAGTERRVLQLADALMDRVRAGDFMFRLSDAQLLLLLVEVDAAGAAGVAQGLLACCRELPLSGPGPVSTRLSASIGLAMHDGHPDFQRLLDRALAALLQARRQGGNGCVQAD